MREPDYHLGLSLYVEILTMIGRKRICSARANDN